jgi:hypothetical protein
MTGNATPSDRNERRRDAVNAVRLICLDDDTAASASRTFNLHPRDLVAARKLLEEWPCFRSLPTTEDERVDYLLGMGWGKRRRAR